MGKSQSRPEDFEGDGKRLTAIQVLKKIGVPKERVIEAVTHNYNQGLLEKYYEQQAMDASKKKAIQQLFRTTGNDPTRPQDVKNAKLVAETNEQFRGIREADIDMYAKHSTPELYWKKMQSQGFKGGDIELDAIGKVFNIKFTVIRKPSDTSVFGADDGNPIVLIKNEDGTYEFGIPKMPPPQTQKRQQARPQKQPRRVTPKDIKNTYSKTDPKNTEPVTWRDLKLGDMVWVYSIGDNYSEGWYIAYVSKVEKDDCRAMFFGEWDGHWWDAKELESCYLRKTGDRFLPPKSYQDMIRDLESRVSQRQLQDLALIISMDDEYIKHLETWQLYKKYF